MIGIMMEFNNSNITNENNINKYNSGI